MNNIEQDPDLMVLMGQWRVNGYMHYNAILGSVICSLEVKIGL